MRFVTGAEEGRRTLLRRQPPGEVTLPDDVWRRTREAVGDVATVEQAVERILADVQEQGDVAVLRYCEAFDGASYSTLRVADDEIAAAYEAVDPDVVRALRFAAERIRAFHEAQREHSMRSFQRDGIGVRASALGRVGINAPGASVVYPSSVLMTAIPAKAAGVEEVLIATPADREGNVAPMKLVAAELAGVDGVYRMSGAQGIAAFAYGTESLPNVDKVCGPGNIFVTLAKRAVFGEVGIDALYGPSETIVIADETADPALCAADLLAQAEHDVSAQAILITDDEETAREVEKAVERQLKDLPRGSVAGASWRDFGAIIQVAAMDDAVALVDAVAPEHLEIMTRDAEELAARIRNAGAIFIGPHTPEAIGDYVAGTNHVLPTARSARFSSGLGVLDFMKRTSLVKCGPEQLRALGSAAVALGEAEGLDAHARSVAMRYNPD